ncbi:MAG TPA: DUF4142 domain-containing protein [Nitrospira sp.]|nr:DUF4142 domain-containing protein [Nitrospira sp.]
MRSINTVMALCAVTVMLSACAMAERAMPGMTLSDANVLGVLNTIDAGEMEAAQLAKEKASSEDVRAYASRIVNDHITSMQETRQLGQRMGVQADKPQLASSLEKTHREAMDQLRQKSGKDFDKAYVQYQIRMHEQAVNLVEDTADSAKHSRLREHLRQLRPDLQSHLSAARTLERQLVAKG